MLDIKKIRKDPNFYSKKLSERNVKINLESLLKIDKSNRELIQKKEKLEQEKKINFTKKRQVTISKIQKNFF